MENIQQYDEFVNEGFLSKSVLALSLSMASLFTNINKADAAAVIVANHSPEYPDEFKFIQDDYEEIYHNLHGLAEHINDPDIKSLIDEMENLKDDSDHMGSKNFLIRINVIKPKLVNLIKKYGTTDYKLEQIYNHITSKDFKRLSVDFGYIKKEIDNIAKKNNVTEWEKMTGEDVAIVVIFSIIGLIVAGFIVHMTFNYASDKIRDRRWKREERARREARINNPPIIIPPPVFERRPRVVRRPVHPPEEVSPSGSLLNGDPVDYRNPKSEHDGKRGTFLSVRDDGKFRIRFDDGVILAASPKYVVPYNDPNKEDHIDLDPHGEEDWSK